MRKAKKNIKKNKNSLSPLSKISGLSVKAMKEIWRGVKENNALLSSCSLHKFQEHESPHMSRRFICKNCRGIVGAVEKTWYEKGLLHSKVNR